jgi:hypothetical protein
MRKRAAVLRGLEIDNHFKLRDLIRPQEVSWFATTDTSQWFKSLTT